MVNRILNNDTNEDNVKILGLIAQDKKGSALESAPPVLDDGEDGTSTDHGSLIGVFKTEERSMTFSGAALSALSSARTTGKVDDITQSTLTIGDVVIHSSAAKKIGVGEDKLLRYGVSAFTKLNAQNEKKPHLRIYGDTREYARACRAPIDAKQMKTAEAQTKENKRAAKALENFIAKLGRNAKNLSAGASFSWRENIKGKPQSYNGITFISAYKITSDVIMLEFSQSAAEYMVKLPLLDTPRAYYGIDDRKPNAFAIAGALIRQYGIENNVIRNTERIIKVETLLKHTSFPTIEDIRKKRTTSWLTLVKEPFEAAMDELYQKGLIAEEVLDENGRRISGGWRYSLSNMRELTDEQASNINNYEQFVSLYIVFELSGYEPHDIRAKAIADRKASQIEKAQRKSRTRAKRLPPPEVGKP